MGRFLLAALGVVFFLIGGGVILLVGKPTLDAAKASKTWPTIDGTVIESRVETKRSNDRNDGPTYRAVVVYDFEVENNTFTSDRIWFGSEVSTSKRQQMRDIVKQYPEGEDVEVFYDPENPAEAVLQPGAFFTSYFMIIFGAVFAVPGGIMFLVGCFVMKSKPAVADSFSNQHQHKNSFDDEESDDGLYQHRDHDDWDAAGDDD